MGMRAAAPRAGPGAIPQPRVEAMLAQLQSAAGAALPLRRGMPCVVGGTKYFLDVSGVTQGQRAEAITAAATAVDALATDSSISLSLGSIDPVRLSQAGRVTINLQGDTPMAATKVERLNGQLPVFRPRPDGGGSSRPDWILPVRVRNRVPPNVTQLSIMGMGLLPDQLQRPGFAALLLRELGVAVEEVVAEFNPEARVHGTVIRLSEKLVVWVTSRRQLQQADIPNPVRFGAYGDLRVFIDSVGSPVSAAAPPARGPPAERPARAEAAEGPPAAPAPQPPGPLPPLPPLPPLHVLPPLPGCPPPLAQGPLPLPPQLAVSRPAVLRAVPLQAAVPNASGAALAGGAAAAGPVRGPGQRPTDRTAPLGLPGQTGVRKHTLKKQRQRRNRREREERRRRAASEEDELLAAARAGQPGGPPAAARAGAVAGEEEGPAATAAPSPAGAREAVAREVGEPAAAQPAVAPSAGPAGEAGAAAGAEGEAAAAAAAPGPAGCGGAVAPAEAAEGAAAAAPPVWGAAPGVAGAAVVGPPPAAPGVGAAAVAAAPAAAAPAALPSAPEVSMEDAEAGSPRTGSFHTVPPPVVGSGDVEMSEGAIASAEQAMALDLHLPVIPRGRMTAEQHAALVQRVRLERGEITEETGSCDGDAVGERVDPGPASPAASGSGDRSWSNVAAARPPGPQAGPARRALPPREARGRGPPRPEEQYAAGGREARKARMGQGPLPSPAK